MCRYISETILKASYQFFWQGATNRKPFKPYASYPDLASTEGGWGPEAQRRDFFAESFCLMYEY